MAHVTVRFFARYAELMGRDTMSIPVSDSTTVADVLEQVRDTLPAARDLPARPLAAVNLRQVKLDARVRDGDEVALLPPLAGG
jgi:molybdopterin converting factor small subunit